MIEMKLKSLPEIYRVQKPISSERAYRHLLPSPKTLVELSAAVVDKLPLPNCWTWSTEDVAHWITHDMKLPQYKECFIKNNIDGQKLLLVEASTMPDMNMTNFEHIQKIAEGIRTLYQIEMPEFGRNIALPPRYPLTHYLLYIQKSGEKYQKSTRVELFRKMKILEKEKDYTCHHWDVLMPAQRAKPKTKILIGLPKYKRKIS